MVHRLILEELKDSEHVCDLIYIRVRVDLYMQVIRKGLDFGPISSAWGVVYFKPRDKSFHDPMRSETPNIKRSMIQIYTSMSLSWRFFGKV